MDILENTTFEEETENIIEEQKTEDFEKVGEEIKKDEGLYESESDISIRSSNNINNILGTQDFDLSYFDKTNLWVNPNSSGSFSRTTITLEDDITDYDFLGIEYTYSYGSINNYITICDRNNFKTTPNYFLCFGTSSGTSTYYSRYISYISDYQIYVSDAVASNNGNGYSNYTIPLKIYGLKKKTESITPSIPGGSVSGNTVNNITNNYYCTVSEDSISNNLIHKKLSEYNTSESLAVLSCLMFLGIGFYLIIRKAVFKWN